MRLFWRSKLKCLFIALFTIVCLVVYIQVIYNVEGSVAVKRITKRHVFLDLPETANSHHKIWKDFYVSAYKDDVTRDGEVEKQRIDVGLATQSSVYHLHNLVHLSTTWQGPISISVFVLGSQWKMFTNILKNMVLCHRDVAQFVTFHVLIPLSHPPDEEMLMFTIDETASCDSTSLRMGSEVEAQNYGDAHVSYPVNALRNVAVDNLGTSHVFMIDVDMVPNMKLRKLLMEKLQMKQFNMFNYAYVVPAFEIFTGSTLPGNKANLLKGWEEGRVRPFYSTVCWKCQKHTDYEKWRRGREEGETIAMFYQVAWTDPWEPFYVIKRQFVHYDERFEQYGFNRISQLCDLHMKGVNFVVLYDAFLLHVGFKDLKTFHKRKDLENNKNRVLYRQFKKEKLKYAPPGRHC